jgi:hypothetical protein
VKKQRLQTIPKKEQRINLVKKSKKRQSGSSSATAASNSSGLDKIDKRELGRRRRQSRRGSKRLGSKTGRGLEQAKAQVSENNGLSDRADLQTLDGLVKQVEMLQKKMRDLFIRAQEIKPRD